MSASVLDAAAQPAVGAGARQAALLLHAVDGVDRKWLMHQLEPAQRELMRALLGELEALGIPPSHDIAGRTLIASPIQADASMPATAAGVTTHPASVATASMRLTERLGEVVPTTLFDLLHDEPDALVLRVLRRAAPRQRSGVLRRFDAARRRRLDDALASGSASAPVSRHDDVLVDALLRRARAHAVEAPVAVGPAALTRIARTYRRWRRARSAAPAAGGLQP